MRTIIDIKEEGDEVRITLDNGVIFWTDPDTAAELNLFDEIDVDFEEE